MARCVTAEGRGGSVSGLVFYVCIGVIWSSQSMHACRLEVWSHLMTVAVMLKPEMTAYYGGPFCQPLLRGIGTQSLPQW